MSMANLIVQGDAAYLMTDSGLFTHGGMLAGLAPKVLVVRQQSLAIAMTGSFHACVLDELLRRIPNWETCEQETFVRAIPGVVRRFYADTGFDPDKMPAEFLIALSSRQTGRPMGLSFITFSFFRDEEPWKLRPRLEAISPPVDLHEAYGRAVRLRHSSFVPWRDALPLIEAQRAVKEGRACFPDGLSAVAGEITLTAVSAAGIECTSLHTYADVEGELVAA